MTPKREAFASALADGLDNSTAYRLAFNTSNMKQETIWNNSSKLAKNTEVAARVAELKSKLEHKQLWTREMSVKGLMSAYQVAQKSNQASGMTMAIRELNVMHGFDQPPTSGDEAEPLMITFNVASPAKEIKITNAKT